jgi:serine/threonine protein kinase/tetratricopeptide (TPR) repeat protein
MSSPQLDEEAVFHIARKLDDPSDRAKYLDQVCAGDMNLRGRVEELLEVHEQEQDFLRSSRDPGPTVDQAPVNERPGTTIGRYRLMEQIGEGGMGVVFVAEQERPVRRKVAIKIVKPGMDTKEVIARFEAERQALALMDHANIARVLDAGSTESGRPYFVMELVRGIPITEYCDQNRLTIRDRLELFVQVSRAVQHAHQKGIIHRDLKPTNVLVTLHDGKPVPKVIDFGVAKATNQRLTERTIYTRFAQIIGTPMYMSPEQAEMSGLDVDTRSDIYSLGVLLYELLTGTTPFDKERFEKAAYDEIRRIVREEQPPKPSTRVSTLGRAAGTVSARRKTDPKRLSQFVRGDLDWIVMKALEKDRTRRYETASAFATDVGRFLSNEPVEARPPSTVYRLKKAAERHRAALAGTAVVVLSLIAGIVSTTWMAIELKGERDVAIQQKEIAQAARERAIEARTEEREKSEQLAASQTVLRETVVLLHDELKAICMAAVMSGDKERAQAAIDRARAAGLPENWLNILRGQLALYSGRPDEAIQFLKPEAPRSVAAEAMLALAYFYSGRLEESAFTVVKLKRRTPETAEDILFTGQAVSVYEPEEGVRRIRLALDKRNSPLARMILAHALAHMALDNGDSELIESALRDAEAARCFLGDTPVMLSTHLFVRHVAIKIGHLKVSDELLAEARDMSRNMADLPFGRLELAWFLEDFGDYESSDRIWSEVERLSGYEAITYISCLLRSRSPAEVLEIIDRRIDSSDSYTQCNKAGVMALIPGMHDEAQEICEKQLRNRGSYDLHNVCLMVLLLLGRPEEAQRLGREALETSELPFRYQKETLQYTAGIIPADTLIRGAGESRINQTAAVMQIAMTELGKGNSDKAKAFFKECVDVGMFVDGNYWWAKRYLKIMEDNPNWPSWIPSNQVE